MPPLRGPDEIAHFLRIYSYTRSEILFGPQIDGRKGIFVERDLHDRLQFFKAAGEWFATARDDGARYGQVMAMYQEFGDGADSAADQDAIFMSFAGSDGYSPAAYIPYIGAGAIGRLLGLDFPDMLRLMRLSGLAMYTVVAGYAIAVTPVLKWAFVLIALLPVSIYNRSVLSADGAAFSSALLITALCLGAACKGDSGRLWERSLWMTLCALSKPPQVVFVLLELMIRRFKKLPGRWGDVAIVVLPCLVLSPLWVVAVSGEMAAWRLQLEGYHPPEHFDPLWKLFYMWENPWHFPLATWRALSGWGDRLWLELIGILGWQDILLPPWVYILLTVLLMLVPLQRLELDGFTRARVMIMAGLTVLGYAIVVYLIFFLTYTPLDTDHVRGVQGRYFIIALPVAAIFVAAAADRELPYNMTSVIATLGSMISGIMTVDVLWQAHW